MTRAVPATILLLLLPLGAGAPAVAEVTCPPGSSTPEAFAEWYQRALQLDAELYPREAGDPPRPLPQELIDLNLALLCDCAASAGTCVPDETTLCLGGRRFEVRVTWERPDGSRGPGRAGRLTADTGYFWFFRETNVELMVKVLDGCTVNDRYWVFAGGLTNVGVELTVRDTVADQTLPYVSSQGRPFQPIQDTGAFATCP